VAHLVRAGVGRPSPATPRLSGIPLAYIGRCLLLARMRLQVQRSELVDADDHRRIIDTNLGGAVGGGVELEDPVLLRFEVRVVRLLNVLIT